MRHGVLIAGGGLAAQRCCETLRSRGYEGPIRIVSDEERPPYDRPPLSKGVLSGERDPATLDYRAADWYADHDVELVLGERAVALDPGIKTLTLASGPTLDYDVAVVATGSRPRKLPGTESFANTHTLRTAADAVRLARRCATSRRLIVVGAGFIGLEVAATARRLGLEVTVLEAAPGPAAAGPRAPSSPTGSSSCIAPKASSSCSPLTSPGSARAPAASSGCSSPTAGSSRATRW